MNQHPIFKFVAVKANGDVLISSPVLSITVRDAFMNIDHEHRFHPVINLSATLYFHIAQNFVSN
jgi:hypothetical protein